MTHAEITELITTLAEPFLTDDDLFLVEVKVAVGQRIEVLIDSDQGVNVSDCTHVARYLQSLPELEPVFEQHELEVSSPGVDEPLKLHRQYIKNIGRTMVITTTDGQKLEGDLTAVQEGKIVLIEYTQVKNIRKNEKTVELPFDNIKQAIVQVKFK